MKKLVSIIMVAAILLAGDKAFGAPAVSRSVPKGWIEDFEAAKRQAAKEGKFILMNFSGSDWCGWCKKMDKEVFSQSKFVNAASKQYVLVMIDSPRGKSILSKLAQGQNNRLKEKYDVRGFPSVVIVDAGGKVVKRHSGYQKGGPKGYLKYLKGLMNGVKWPDKNQLKQESNRNSGGGEDVAEDKDDASASWLTDCGEAQSLARATGKLIFVYNHAPSENPGVSVRERDFSVDPAFLSYVKEKCVLLAVEGWGESLKESYPWAYTSGWPDCRLLDADGKPVVEKDGRGNMGRLGGSDDFQAGGRHMADLVKGCELSARIMPAALAAFKKDSGPAGLAELHKALSQLPEAVMV